MEGENRTQGSRIWAEEVADLHLWSCIRNHPNPKPPTGRHAAISAAVAAGSGAAGSQMVHRGRGPDAPLSARPGLSRGPSATVLRQY